MTCGYILKYCAIDSFLRLRVANTPRGGSTRIPNHGSIEFQIHRRREKGIGAKLIASVGACNNWLFNGKCEKGWIFLWHWAFQCVDNWFNCWILEETWWFYSTVAVTLGLTTGLTLLSVQWVRGQSKEKKSSPGWTFAKYQWTLVSYGPFSVVLHIAGPASLTLLYIGNLLGYLFQICYGSLCFICCLLYTDTLNYKGVCFKCLLINWTEELLCIWLQSSNKTKLNTF